MQGANHDLHSGVYGGAAPNPMQAIAEIICALKDRDGRILIPGFYDRVVPPSAKEREAWARLPFDEREYTEKEMGARELVGEPGVPLFERVWARPTLEVHGIRGGFTGEGAKTVIPARAVAKISTRLVADQRVDEAIAQMQAAVKAACPRGVTAELKVLHAGAPSLTNPDNPFIHAAAEALKETFGKETVYIRSGGSHPDRRGVRPLPGHSQRDDGLRPAGRQSACAEREVPPAELLSRHRGGRAVSGDTRSE